MKVSAIITGAVKTNVSANTVQTELPPNSLYSKCETNISKRAKNSDIPWIMMPDDYAEKAVGDILGGATGKIWRGAMASMVRSLIIFLPSWISMSVNVLSNGMVF